MYGLNDESFFRKYGLVSWHVTALQHKGSRTSDVDDPIAIIQNPQAQQLFKHDKQLYTGTKRGVRYMHTRDHSSTNLLKVKMLGVTATNARTTYRKLSTLNFGLSALSVLRDSRLPKPGISYAGAD